MYFDICDEARFDRCLEAVKSSIEDQSGYSITMRDSDIIRTLVDGWMDKIEDSYDTEAYRVILPKNEEE